MDITSESTFFNHLKFIKMLLNELLFFAYCLFAFSLSIGLLINIKNELIDSLRSLSEREVLIVVNSLLLLSVLVLSFVLFLVPGVLTVLICVLSGIITSIIEDQEQFETIEG